MLNKMFCTRGLLTPNDSIG